MHSERREEGNGEKFAISVGRLYCIVGSAKHPLLFLFPLLSDLGILF